MSVLLKISCLELYLSLPCPWQTEIRTVSRSRPRWFCAESLHIGHKCQTACCASEQAQPVWMRSTGCMTATGCLHPGTGCTLCWISVHDGVQASSFWASHGQANWRSAHIWGEICFLATGSGPLFAPLGPPWWCESAHQRKSESAHWWGWWLSWVDHQIRAEC